MRALIASTLALALSTTSLAAAAEVGPLSPGKPAGVKNADLGGVPVGVVVVVGLVAIIAIVVASSGGGTNATPGTAPPGTAT